MQICTWFLRDWILRYFSLTLALTLISNLLALCPKFLLCAVFCVQPAKSLIIRIAYVFLNYGNILENVATNDAFTLKAARRDAIANLKSLFGTSNLNCSADKPNAVIFRFAVERHVNALSLQRACAMDCGRNRIPRVGKISGHIVNKFVDQSPWNFGTK